MLPVVPAASIREVESSNDISVQRHFAITVDIGATEGITHVDSACPTLLKDKVISREFKPGAGTAHVNDASSSVGTGIWLSLSPTAERGCVLGLEESWESSWGRRRCRRTLKEILFREKRGSIKVLAIGEDKI